MKTFITTMLILSGTLVAFSYYDSPTPRTPASQQTCYEGTGETVKPEFQAESAMIRVKWITGVINVDGDDVVGYSEYTYDEDLDTSICLIYIPMPSHVLGDDKMDTVGHELLHCLTGSFHQ